MTSLQQIKKVLNTSSGEDLREYLLARLNQLKDITNIKDIENAESQAVEVKAQKKAYSKLQEIYSEILTFSEEDKKKDDRDFYSM